MKMSDRALNGLRARVEGLLEPREIRRIRRKLGLTQAQAGRLTGGGPRAFQKYEAGDLLPSRAIGSALALVNHDPSALEVLRERQGGGCVGRGGAGGGDGLSGAARGIQARKCFANR